MRSLYCPYCSSLYQDHRKRADGIMICGQCGDPLVKDPFFKPTQVFALIVIAAFISPLILMLVAFIKDSTKPQKNQSLDSIAVLQYVRKNTL